MKIGENICNLTKSKYICSGRYDISGSSKSYNYGTKRNF